MAIYKSGGNCVDNNVIEGTRFDGIYLSYASENTIANNSIQRTGISFSNISHKTMHAVELVFSKKNTIAKNVISTTNGYGIMLFGDSNDNVIYANSFIGCPMPVLDKGKNIWDKDGIGNYWSDYQGEDADGDGIGDTPKQISLNSTDRFPVIQTQRLQVSVPVQQSVVPAIFTLPWSMRISGDVVWSAPSMTLSARQIDIPNGASLTIKNTTLHIPKGTNGFYVYSGGSLTIIDSKIIPDEGGGGFLLSISEGAHFVMRGSEISGIGASTQGDWGSIFIQTSDATIENNTISGCGSGIDISLPGFMPIKDSKVYIRNNQISNCLIGISLSSERDFTIGDHIENNTISSCYEAFSCDDHYNNIVIDCNY